MESHSSALHPTMRPPSRRPLLFDMIEKKRVPAIPRTSYATKDSLRTEKTTLVWTFQYIQLLEMPRTVSDTGELMTPLVLVHVESH